MLVNFSGQNKTAVSFGNNTPAIQVIDPQSLSPQMVSPQYVGQPVYNQLPAGKPVKKVYENPVNMNWEYFAAGIKALAFSALVGLGAAWVLKKDGAAGLNWSKGKLCGGIAAALTVPIAIYHRSVSGFVKKREMDEFSRLNKAEVNLTEKIDDKASDDNYPLSDAIDLYTRFNVGRQGGGMILLNR